MEEWEKLYYLENKNEKQRHEWDLVNKTKLIINELLANWEDRVKKTRYITNQSIPMLKGYLNDIEKTIVFLKHLRDKKNEKIAL